MAKKCYPLLKSLQTRFDELLKQDIFKISTVLDPYYGLKYIPLDERPGVLRCLKLNLNKIFHTKAIATPAKDKVHKNESKRKELYVNFDSEDSDSNVIDDMDTQINEYFALIKNGNFTNALDFWRVHQHTKNLQGLSKLAKKFFWVYLHHLLKLNECLV